MFGFRRTHVPKAYRSPAGRTLITMPGLILASTSPRRRALLSEHGYEHRAISPGIDDAELVPPPTCPPRSWCAALAYLKARAAWSKLQAQGIDPDDPDLIILAADTIVVKERRILGQPRDHLDAAEIITALSNGRHTVITGVALLNGPRRQIFSDESSVRVGHIPAEFIDQYVRSGAWRGKAGGYNLAERLADGWPIEFEGDPSSIMGLPMRRLATALDRWHAGAGLRSSPC